MILTSFYVSCVVMYNKMDVNQGLISKHLMMKSFVATVFLLRIAYVYLFYDEPVDSHSRQMTCYLVCSGGDVTAERLNILKVGKVKSA